MLKLRLDLFFKEFLLYSLTLIAGIFIAVRYGQQAGHVAVQPINFSAGNLLELVIFFIIFSFFLSRYKRLADWSFRIFLALVVLSGSQLFFSMFLRAPYDFAGAVIILALMLFVRTVLTHNLGVIIGIAGIAAFLGVSITPPAGAVILALLSVYDVVSVYKTRHMVALADNMVRSGAIFGLLVPAQWKGFLFHRRDARVGDGFMILGSGDVGVPIALVASLAVTSLPAALAVSVFVLGGLFLTHLLFMNQVRRQPMAALPPIAMMAVLGYLFAVIIGL